MCYALGDDNMVFLANYLLVAHCFTTASEFFLVDCIARRYGTRDFWQVCGL
jgi:formate hydrogenlyase subunit 3/multisubunit Na+/H+ antiporter MnhD subunit